MLQETAISATVYQVLDQVLADASVASSSRCAMFFVIDSLRQISAPVEDIRRAEAISLQIHKLEWALQKRDAAGSTAALDELRLLAAGWLDSRICS